MRWFNKLERKYRHLAIPGLIHYVIILHAVVYVLMLFEPRFIQNLILIPSLVFQGQIWRIITFLFIPPQTSILWIVFVLYFYYMVGSALEETWGSFKFTLYYFIGALGTIAGAFFSGLGMTSLYLNLSLFLAFARLFPEYQILLFLMLPVKVKYLAYLNWFFIGYTVLLRPFPFKVAAVASLINFFLFFGPGLFQSIKGRKRVHQSRRRFSQGLKAVQTQTIHSCRVCGVTEEDDPLMEFRYCSQCSGDHEYCMEHLYDHTHD